MENVLITLAPQWAKKFEGLKGQLIMPKTPEERPVLAINGSDFFTTGFQYVPLCATCGNACKPEGCSTGYGTDEKGFKHCFQCCGAREEADLKATGKGVLYLTQDEKGARLTNWPNTLKIALNGVSKGRHNFAGNRYDVWFKFDGSTWHGTQYGDNTQICHVKRLKN